MSDPFKCIFNVEYAKEFITTGSVYFYGNFSKKDLKSNNKLMKRVVDNVYNKICSEISDDLPEDFHSDDLVIITYFPDLVD